MSHKITATRDQSLRPMLVPDTKHQLQQFFRKPVQIIRDNFRAYLIINAIVYGSVIAGLIAAMVFPILGAIQLAVFEANGTIDLIRSGLENPWQFSLTIFGVNVMSGALFIVLPSLIVPFAGIPVFVWKAFTLGIAMAPTTATKAVAMIPHSLTALVEFQAYALLMFGAYILGRSWIRATTIGTGNHRQGYVRGLQKLGWLGLFTLPLFIAGAIWEALSLGYLVTPLIQWLL